jgi:hypothetical protein
MISLFSTPKAWEGHIGIIQRNAMRSWQELGCETFLFCNDKGTKQAAKQFKAKHISKVRRTRAGTPVIGQIFKQMQGLTNNDILVYLNTDIILVRGFIESINYVADQFDNFLVVGSRYNLDVDYEIDYTGGWQNEYERLALNYGKPHPGTGVDYFAFRKGMFMDMPNFALGRGFWDTWLIGKAIKDNIPVFDSTKTIFVIHQNHTYAHLPKEAPKRGNRDKWYSKGPETEMNKKLRAGINKSCQNADYILEIDPFTGSLIHF